MASLPSSATAKTTSFCPKTSPGHFHPHYDQHFKSPGIMQGDNGPADAQQCGFDAHNHTAASPAFTGLMPGASYNLAVNVVGSADPSNWSNPITQFAI